MTRTFVFAFDPEPEGGYTVTCPALPGLVTYGETMEQARTMALDAMAGLIEVMIEQGERIPESDMAYATDRFVRLAQSLHPDVESGARFEALTTRVVEAA